MWSRAFLIQAHSDWDTYQILKTSPCADCHGLHYLQMATEKLAKAAMLRTRHYDLNYVSKHHEAFTEFLRIQGRNANLQKLAGMTPRQLNSHIKSMLPIAQELEYLAPAVATAKGTKVNVEYPWASSPTQIRAPADYNFPLMQQLAGSTGRSLLRLVELMLNRFDRLFGT